MIVMILDVITTNADVFPAVTKYVCVRRLDKAVCIYNELCSCHEVRARAMSRNNYMVFLLRI